MLPHYRWLSHLPPDISSDRAIIAWTAEERRNILRFPRQIRKKKRFPSIPYWQATCCVFAFENFQWYHTENLVPTPKRSEEEEEIDLDPEQLTVITQKERNM